tara:strand:+ start:638 stop:1036 length:399 start_codon:yes stop_codon:yes gene_type:complete
MANDLFSAQLSELLFYLKLGTGFLIFLFIAYIYSSIAIMKVAKRTKTSKGWLAFIPIANFYLMAKMAGKSGWTMFAFFLVLVPTLGIILLAAVIAWWWWSIAEKCGKPNWYGVLMAIPIVNLVIVGLLAWQK